MGSIRKKLLNEKHEPEAHKYLFEAIIENGLIDLIKKKKTGDIDALLYEVLGEGYEYEKLMKKGKDGVS